MGWGKDTTHTGRMAGQKMEVKTMTTRELRAMLFNVENQEMTVRELRHILFDVNDQDSELTWGRLALMTDFGKTYYEYTIEGENLTRKYSAETKPYEFFHDVAGCISMGDCSGEEVKKIVFQGEEFQYMGWMPDNQFNFRGTSGETKCYFFPEFEH